MLPREILDCSHLPVRVEAMWKASEVEAIADYFDVSVGDLFDGLGLFRDTKSPTG